MDVHDIFYRRILSLLHMVLYILSFALKCRSVENFSNLSPNEAAKRDLSAFSLGGGDRRNYYCSFSSLVTLYTNKFDYSEHIRSHLMSA